MISLFLSLLNTRLINYVQNSLFNYKLQSNTIRDFDTAYTIRMFNYSDISQYYEDASLSHKLHRINIPCLCLSAADDPFLYLKGTQYLLLYYIIY